MSANTAKVINLPTKGSAPQVRPSFHRFLTLQDGSECIFCFGYDEELCVWSSNIVSDSVGDLVKMLRESASVLESGGLRREV